MTRYLYALWPLLIFVVFAVIACLLGYFLVHIFDNLPLHQIISKTTLVFLALSIFPAMRCLQLDKEDLGFTNKTDFFRQLWQGFALGFVTLLPVFIILYILGVNVIDETKLWTVAKLAEKLSVALLLALLISLLEEPLFRGVLLAGLGKKFTVPTAVFISAVYYAALHFVTSKTAVAQADLQLWSAFRLLGEAIVNVVNPVNFSAFLALLMVGIFLGSLRAGLKTGLGLCIGCHTAWVWQIKISKEWFNTDVNALYAYLVNPYDGVIGWLVTAWLIVAMMGYWFYRYYWMKIV